MSCVEFEERIARYVGGDPAPEDVAEHLRVCPDCAELARGLEEDRAWLASRPPDAAEIDYEAMRREIRAAISRPRRSWKWLAAAAAVLLAVGAASLRQAPAPQPVVATPNRSGRAALDGRAKALRRLKPAPLGFDHFGGPQGHGAVLRRPTQPPPDLTLEAAIGMFEALDSPAPPAGSDSPVEMRISTRDPNVTIILLQESKGDSQ